MDLVHKILQARVLEWVAFPFFRGSSGPRDRTQVSHIAGRFFTSWATREIQEYWSGQPIPSPVDLPDPGIELKSLTSQVDSLPTELWRKPNWSISNPKRWCSESAALNMPANLENSAVATGLEKVSFHSHPKEKQCQRMFKLLHSCTCLTHDQSNTQNSPSQASIVCELRTYRCSSWI